MKATKTFITTTKTTIKLELYQKKKRFCLRNPEKNGLSSFLFVLRTPGIDVSIANHGSRETQQIDSVRQDDYSRFRCR